MVKSSFGWPVTLLNGCQNNETLLIVVSAFTVQTSFHVQMGKLLSLQCNLFEYNLFIQLVCSSLSAEGAYFQSAILCLVLALLWSPKAYSKHFKEPGGEGRVKLLKIRRQWIRKVIRTDITLGVRDRRWLQWNVKQVGQQTFKRWPCDICLEL